MVGKKRLVLFILLASGFLSSYAAAPFIRITSIKIVVEDVYGNDDLHWLQQAANKYHINTKQTVILSLLAIREGDRVSPNQLLEAERLLRNQSYLRDAKLILSDDGMLQVTVVDNWTLFPTFSFNRTGGQNSSSIGIRDTNLLGLGVAATFSYKKDQQKSGYRFRLTAPTSDTNHSYTSLVLEEYDTGSQKAFSYVRPFYTSKTQHMWQTSIKTSELENTFYQNDDDLGVTTASNNQFRINYGWLDSYQNNTAYRTRVGYAYDSSELLEFDSPQLANLYSVRKRTYFWWGKEQFESRFKVLKNIFIINNKEDINLGWHTSYQVGVGHIETINDDQPTLDYFDESNILKSNMFKFFSIFSTGNYLGSSLFLHRFRLNAELFENDKIEHYYSTNYNLDIFYPFTNRLSFYNGNQFTYLSQFRQEPSALGGDSGLRGYPTSYQWGRKRYLSNFELRYYSDTVLWDTFSIGYVFFTDIGRAWKSEEFENLENGTLKSVGVGIRIFPNMASGRNVVHVDFARPYSRNAKINEWEWRIQVKNSF